MPGLLARADQLAIRVRLLETPRCGPRRGVDHVYSLRRWRDLLLEHDAREYGDPPEPEPAVTTSREARVQLLEERARLGLALFTASDVVRMGPAEEPAGCRHQRRSG